MPYTDLPADPPAEAQAATPLRHRLSTRIISLSLAVLLVVLGMISGTLWLSWKLEGAGAAINDAGSLRMRANRVAIELTMAHAQRDNALAMQVQALDGTLAQLRRGNPSRPLFLPDEPAIHAQLARVTQDWHTQLRPIAMAGADSTAPARYIAALPGFVAQADTLVGMIEHDSARKTDLLRLSQTALALMACVGTVAVIYLLYLWIILPVLRLQDGLRRMAAREFSLRLPVETRDEFGTLSEGFNRMAGELQGLYRDLEARVAQKTAELERQNRDLETLYDMAAFLNQASDADTMARGFLARVMRQFDAEGGSVRVLDPRHGRLHLLASAGLPAALAEAASCAAADACHCGDATREAVITITDLRGRRDGRQDGTPCARNGFQALAAFRIESQRGATGVFALHFRTPRALPASDRQLLETLGQHLGTALEHLRLSATARQLAVVEERNLVAQGLHDSIAQGLNYLNLQVQLLDDAVARDDLGETREIVPMLRHGVEESYQDVRELLNNFRSRLGGGELRPAVEDTVARFRRQCRTEATLTIDEQADGIGASGRPLSPEQQLQVLFILQEALSNVRKHALAAHVTVALSHGRDFRLVVEDDGEGFDPAELATRADAHIGLNIMRERAARLDAQLHVQAAPGRGVRIELVLPRRAPQTTETQP
ncbi:type IV pili methyl-accepting chemotaxis transducer N-terminal domain-containing protein [Cupriavidus oxalaticus]|jgi:two-component system nitrate/nitrite sensor histidine kinase NarX|uniref:Sensor protein n=1 Tax=Cupriavidus oxalaticus TaxID=96344 RepID=A0A375GIR6_9BURK|nr:type IV pili methyl-accepting chemotaxis transducer N-terminal domain-containing protein [Cupriavidus oxalaticus]QEZ43857.1 HAMP domain-containing protein [Cupriavidus oxalaticus]QRQ84736.1 type IV pili methyl-accepting chemotaxis transducer N-terminal domain-containing protein [Cupriavidus oxalaticus]QRQ91175.1 type IV pili methyl-accepting chemotaxis transducer N-terminal domain-containing protein [Cupriavidus oxalaticus]WQD85726.1 type IV pili methyl-accepting chemotaxis transducer N-term